MGRGFDLVQGDRFVFGVFSIVELVAQAVEFIQSGRHSQPAKVLACDFLLTDDFGFGALELFGCEPVAAQQFGLAQQFAFDQRHFLRLGADIEGEVACGQSEKILRAHVIGQAELFTNAHKQA